MLGRQRLDVPPATALRCCSKVLRDVCNYACDSMFFQMTDLEEVKKYLVKLHLSYVSVLLAHNTKQPKIRSSLAVFHSLQPNLTSLALRHVTAPPQNRKIRANVKNQLLPWRSTLECLVMHGVDFGSLDDFLSQMHALRALELKGFSPALSPTNILECWRLVELNFKGAGILDSSLLDLSSCRSLQNATLPECALTALNVEGLTSLVSLLCSNNNLTVLQISTCTSLKQLKCADNKLTVLDLTNNKMLEVLDCSTNPISGLDLNNCELLQKFNCIDCNSFNSLSFPNCTGITNLHTNHKNIAAQELQACSGLSIVKMSDNSAHAFTRCKLANLDGLTSVHLSKTSVEVLNFSFCCSLKTLEVHHNRELWTLIIEGCISLQTVSVKDCGVRYMDVIDNAALESFTCTNCPVFSLDFSRPTSCASLRQVWLQCPRLHTLDMSLAAATLQTLACSKSSQLNALCISGCSKLSALDCSECSALEELKCGGCSNLSFEPLQFNQAANFHFMTMPKLRAVGGLTAQKTVSVYMDKRKVRVGGSKFWPLI